MRIDDPGWTILFPDLKDGYRGYEEIRFDGRNTFATTCFKHLTNAPIGAVDITSEVRTGPLPGPEKIHMGSFLWFALCSERFLAAHHEAYVRLDPLWPSADEVFSMRYQPLALISGSSSVPHLPAQAKFFLDDGIDFTSKDSIGATIRQWRRNELPKDAESGRLWCTYASSGRMSEKTLSFEFPREFEFRVFIFPRSVVDPGEASDGFYSIKGVVRSVSPVPGIGAGAGPMDRRSGKPTVPALHGERNSVRIEHISDFRYFDRIRGVQVEKSYVTTNQVLIPLESPQYEIIKSSLKPPISGAA